ncbi:MAG: riboflavin synthase [Pirellulales bacterium]
MFSGIVEHLGAVAEVQSAPPGKRLEVDAGPLAEAGTLGASIAVNGCCLTVITRQGTILAFDVGPETLARTNLAQVVAGDRVNLEASLRVGDRLGGHFVSGHIDAVGRVLDRRDEREWSYFTFGVPRELTRLMVDKGCVAVDGVSLTVVDVADESFRVMLIPHTLSVTTLGRRQIGDGVNIEADLLAKYVRRQMEGVLGS